MALEAVSLRLVEVLAPGTGIQGGPQEADCRQCQLVDRDRRTFGGCLMQGVSDEPGGNGRNATTGRTSKLICRMIGSDRGCRSVNAVWASQAAPISGS